MSSITIIIILSLLTENIINELKNIFKDKNFNWEFLSIIIGTLLSFTFGKDILSNFNIIPNENIPVIFSFLLTNILTGFLIGRGSNVVFKFINILDYKKEEMKNNVINN